MTDQELIKAVVESYDQTESFKKTAADLHISTAKVRKALLTAGVWTNDTADEIAALREKKPEMTDQQIAAHLHISLNTVQMYTPYKVGPYEGDGPSAERMAEYRTRNAQMIDKVDQNRIEVAGMMAAEDEEDPFDRPLDDLSWYDEEKKKAEEAGLPFPMFRYNPDPNAKPHVDDQFYLDYRLVEHAHESGRHPTLHAMKIRLEIDTEGMSAEELGRIAEEYGVKTGWTRDLIVPSYIPLHFLHYVIQRAFGFENKADHVFQLLPGDFSVATEDSLNMYCRLCGVLFRFPYGNDAELYWDDDYDGKKSIRTWLKEKYEGSWLTDAGTGYSYADNQYRIWKWLGDKVPDIHKLGSAFDAEDYYEELMRLGAPEEYSIGDMNEEDTSVLSGQFPANNVLESLTLEELLCMEPESFSIYLETAEEELLDNMLTLEKAREVMAEAEEIYKHLEKRMKAGQWDEDVLLVKRWREKAKEAAELFVLSRGGATVEPFTRELIYCYDFGKRKGLPIEGDAKWKIRIKVLEEYYDNSIYYSRNYTAADASGVLFRNDPEHEAEMADRLHAMCHWKEKLEITDSSDRWIIPADETEMMLSLAPEQELLPQEREEIEERRRELEESDRYFGYETKEKEVLIDDAIYKALKVVMLEKRPVCIGKEGTEPGEGYPEVKVRNSSVAKLL